MLCACQVHLLSHLVVHRLHELGVVISVFSIKEPDLFHNYIVKLWSQELVTGSLIPLLTCLPLRSLFSSVECY